MSARPADDPGARRRAARRPPRSSSAAAPGARSDHAAESHSIHEGNASGACRHQTVYGDDAVRARYPGEMRATVVERCTRSLREAIDELTEVRDRLARAPARDATHNVSSSLDVGRSVIAGEIEGLRQLIFELRPPAFAEPALRSALEALLEQTSARDGLHTGLDSAPADVELPLIGETALAVYRITQEAIRNAVEHGAADEITVRLQVGDEVCVDVNDDGRGFTPATVRPGFGLATMRERAQLINGLVYLESTPGEGSRIRIEVPLTDEAGADTAVRTLDDAHAVQRFARLRRGVHAQEAECMHWAREIHDDPLQHLAATLAETEALPPRRDSSGLQEAADRMQAGVDAALSGLSELVDDLSLPAPLRLGLPGSLALLTQRARRDGLVVTADISPRLHSPPRAEDTLSIYRIAQEALTNAIKHSRASAVTVSAHQAWDTLSVIVSDDGLGFDPGASSEGYGMTGMRERAELMGAALTVRSLTGHGTIVRLDVHDTGSG